MAHIGDDTPTTEQPPCPWAAEPQDEHRWLQRLVGEWSSETTVRMPGQPPATERGRESVRSLGGLWVVAEGEGAMSGGGTMIWMMTLGYDPRKERYVGTFLCSVMTHLWIYEGHVDETGQALVLDTEGPDMAKGGDSLTKFQDIIRFEDEGDRLLTSRMLGEDGQWTEIVTARYQRKEAS